MYQLIVFAVVVGNDACPRGDPSSHLGLDGTEKHNSLRPVAGMHNRPDLTTHHSATRGMAAIPHDQPHVLDSWSVSESDELEYNNTRRKRRRVSETETELPLQTQHNLDASTADWHEQLQQAATSSGGDLSRESEYEFKRSAQQPSAVNTGKNFDLNQAVDLMGPGDMDEQGTYTSRTGETFPSQSSEELVSSTTSLHATAALPELEMPQSTPKKKPLRVEVNGKLTNSPQRQSRRSSRSKKAGGDQVSTTNNVAPSSRKMEMKNGKLVSSLRVTLLYKSPDCGRQIDDILSPHSSKPDMQVPVAQSADIPAKDNKATHPFFLGKLASKAQKQALVKSEQSTITGGSDNESNQVALEAPKSWKDIKFTAKKPSQSKAIEGVQAMWPTLSLQLVEPSRDRPIPQAILPRPTSALKSKHHVPDVSPYEDVLWMFARKMKNGSRLATSLHLPERRVLSGKALNAELDAEIRCQHDHSDHIAPLRTRIESTLSPFDKGMAAGPQMWPQEYAPTSWQEVLQPQVQVLHDWLSNLKVHQVHTGKIQPKLKPLILKKRRKRKSDDMDNFIVNSDDEDQNSTGKNAILIIGPSGCGKTAAVFAVAQQLGFEVFEIHPGMRRSARDIQEKVGDMTQNHLVQQASSLSRDSSMSLEDSNAACSPFPEQPAANQSTMANFMNFGKGTVNQKAVEILVSKEAKVKAQKQSLILFEEVDILFEEDKGFWSGVQSLIRTSKRPVIMTCNNPESVPLDELDLFTVLAFGYPEERLSVERLGCVAAAEGHLLSKDALETLYLTKGRDLRASLTELNLWCQMTVGSQQGGLDWMLPQDVMRQAAQDGTVTRIVSQDTFVSGLDLYPTELDDSQDMVEFCQESLCLPPLDWVKDAVVLGDAGGTASGLQALDDMLLLSDVRSVMDVADSDVACLMAGMILKNRAYPRQDVVRLYLEQQNTTDTMTRAAVADALDALMEDNRIGLPISPGRKAPSLDNAAQSLVTEVAPYVRAIVEHDQRLEQLRTELGGGGSQAKRQRKTRASRAALEGGTKVNTRRDKWFPESLDFSAVFATGGNGWPQFRPGEVEVFSAAATPSSSMATELEGEALEAPK